MLSGHRPPCSSHLKAPGHVFVAGENAIPGRAWNELQCTGRCLLKLSPEPLTLVHLSLPVPRPLPLSAATTCSPPPPPGCPQAPGLTPRSLLTSPAPLSPTALSVSTLYSLCFISSPRPHSPSSGLVLSPQTFCLQCPPLQSISLMAPAQTWPLALLRTLPGLPNSPRGLAGWPRPPSRPRLHPRATPIPASPPAAAAPPPPAP